MSILLHHLRFGLRKLLREPVLPLVVVLVLAVGIGANTLMFMVLDRMVLRPLPLSGLDRLAAVWETDPLKSVTKGSVSPSNFLDWQAQSRSFETMAAMRRVPLNLSVRNGGTLQVQGVRVTGDFFRLLPFHAAQGRLFHAQAGNGDENTAVISHGLWQKLYSSDPGIVGRPIAIDGRLLTVVGVLNPREEFPLGTEVWLPVRLEHGPNSRGSRSLFVIGGLKPGVTLRQAQAELDRIARGLQQEFPDTNRQSGIMLTQLRDELVANYRSTVWLLSAGLALILLIVCVNVTSILVIRAAARKKEFAISIALGSSRGEVIRQLMTEVFLITGAGAGLGLALALGGRSLLEVSALGRLVRAETLTLDLRILMFTLMVVLIVGSIMVLIPASQFLGVRLNVLSADGGELGRGEGRRETALQRSLVTLQLAMSVPLLVAALLLFQNLHQIGEIDLGFNPKDVLTWRVSFSQEGLSPVRRAEIVGAGVERVGALPGVEEVAYASDLPFSGSRTSGDFVISGRKASAGDFPSSDLRIIGGDYFRALGIPLKRGRVFGDQDGRFASGVAVVNESLAQRYWPGEDPIGHRIRIGSPEERALFGGSVEREIVGIVGDIVDDGLGAVRRPEVYLPYGQCPSAGVTLVVRSRRSLSAGFATAVANAFTEDRKESRASSVRPMREIVSRALGFPEVQTGSLIFLSLLALLLVGLSVYAVISYFLAKQRRSIMVRIALGAQSRSILWLLARQGMVLCLGGTAVGAVASLCLSRVLLHQVHLIQPRTISAILLGAALVIVLTLFTCLAPTRRILDQDPAVVLRHE
jgi:putative ABC transport system permease protein